MFVVLPATPNALPMCIAVLHFDSLACLPAMKALFEGLGERVVRVASSRQLAGLRIVVGEARCSFARLGLAFTLALGVDNIALQFGTVLMPHLRRADARAWRSPRELADRAGWPG